ncbi:MAG: hypothetical protein GTO02_03010 [Candidatus Dadabacteria bacterium]|nr:hypothetical protein [Candidatus Dadabacteria bacterium]
MIDINKKYKTKCGKEVEIVKIENENDYPVIGLVKIGLYFNHPHTWTLDGKFLTTKDDEYDLVEQNTIKQGEKQCN